MALRLKGSTSGSVELNVPAAVSGGDVTLTLPNGTGSANQFLKNGSSAGTLEYSSIVEDGSGNITTTGSATFTGAVTATNTAKAWIKWDGTVSSNYILDSFGVDSLDDNTTGNFTIHLTDTMQNADYVVVCGATTDATGGIDTWINAYAQTTTTFTVQSQNASSQSTNRDRNFAVVFGDKA